MERQLTLFDQDIWFGKTYPEPSVQTKEKTSKPSLPKSSKSSAPNVPMFLYLTNGQNQAALWGTERTDNLFPLPTDYTTHSFGEYPKEEKGSLLSQILMESPHPKYFLSEKACQGILRRAKARNKELPQMLKEALERQSVSRNGGGKPGGGKGILIQNEHIGAMKTNQNQYVCSKPIGFNRGCGSGLSIAEEKEPTIQAAAGESGNNQPLVCQPILLESNQNHATIQTDGVSTTLPASMGMGGGYVPMVCKEESYCIGNGQINDALCPSKEVSKTLNCMNDPIKVLTNKDGVICTSHGGFMINADDSGIAHTLQATDYKDAQVVSYGVDSYNQSATEETANTVRVNNGGDNVGKVCYALDRAMFNQGVNAAYKPSIEKELSQTLVSKGPGAVCARDYKGVGNEYVQENKLVVGSLCARDYKGAIVRRLTPLECERLQGFPDNWTDIGDWIDSKGKKHKGDSDAPRYKALGNSIALPFWQYLAEKMCKYIDDPKMASLFDGISGFPLVYSRCGCKPVWASEIEEFPIAVAKMRFGEE